MSELANMAQQFSGLPMDSLIGGPLIAAAEANAKMAQSQADFIMRIGFNKTLVKNDTFKEADQTTLTKFYEKDTTIISEYKEVYNPIMVQLKLTRPSLDENGNQLMKGDTPVPPAIFQIDIPLLSIVPINSLAVTNVDIHFEMEVKSSFSESTSESSKSSFGSEASVEASAGWGWGSVSIKGSASYSSEDAKSRDTHYQKSNNAKYVVDVKAGQLPLPTGITTILDVYAKNIFPTPIGKKTPAPVPVPVP